MRLPSVALLIALTACKGGDDDTPVDDTGDVSVDADGDGFNTDVDCDDDNPDIHPDAAEVCDGVDNNCDDTVDEADPEWDASTGVTSWVDGDGDGYGSGDPIQSCDEVPENSDVDGDCDDSDAAVSPAATEICNGVDDDCDGTTDVDASDSTVWYADTDGDGFGDLNGAPWDTCEEPGDGWSTDATDCDDTDGAVNPGGTEVCDGLDNDCDASTSEAGMVSWVDAEGVWSDVTADFTGTSEAPLALTVAEPGTAHFCEGTHYVNLVVEADVELLGTGRDAVTLHGGDVDSVISTTAEGLSLAVRDLTLTGGVAVDTGRFLGGYYAGGGGISCLDDTASSSVEVSDSRLDSMLAAVGGGIAVEGCDLTVARTTFANNEADYGAAIMQIYGSSRITDSELSGGLATYSGGGIFVYGSDADIELVDTLITGNEAGFAGALYLQSASGSCESTGDGNHGFTSNTSTSLGTIFGTADFTSVGCDFGTVQGADDNDSDGYEDLYWGNVDYTAGDDTSFTCDSSGCGDTDYFLVGDADRAEVVTDSLYGNIFLADADSTLHDVGIYAEADESCSIVFQLLSSSTGAEGDWTVEWEDTVAFASGEAYQTSGPMDAFLTSGSWYAVVAGGTCTSGDITLYAGEEPNIDAGFGDGVGEAWYDAAPTTGVGSQYVYVETTRGAPFGMSLTVTVWN